MYQNILKSISEFKEKFQIKYRYTGVYKNEESIRTEVLGSLGAITFQCLALNIPSIGLKIKETNDIFKRVHTKGGVFGSNIINLEILSKVEKLAENNQNLAQDIYEKTELSKYYSCVVQKIVAEINKDFWKNISNEHNRINKLIKLYKTFTQYENYNQYV